MKHKINDLTNEDRSDLIEGIKERGPHKWKTLPTLNNEEKLIRYIVDSNGIVDLTKAAKKFDKTTSEVDKIIQELGYY